MYAYEDIFAAARKAAPETGPSGTVVLTPQAAGQFSGGLSKPVIAGLVAAAIFAIVIATASLVHMQHVRRFAPRSHVVLAEPAAVEASTPEESGTAEEKTVREDLTLRLRAASTMTSNMERDEALAKVAKAAAAAGEGEIAKKAAQSMLINGIRDDTRRDCALELMKHGQRKQAIEIASGIMSSSIRNDTLAELAK